MNDEPVTDRETPAEINGIPVLLDEAQADGTMRFRMNLDVMGPIEGLIDAAETVSSWRESGMNDVPAVNRDAGTPRTEVSSEALDRLLSAIAVAKRADAVAVAVMSAQQAHSNTVTVSLDTARKVCKMLAEPDSPFGDTERAAVNELMQQTLARVRVI